MNTTDLESDLEVELLEARSQGSLRKHVSIRLAEKIHTYKLLRKDGTVSSHSDSSPSKI